MRSRVNCGGDGGANNDGNEVDGCGGESTSTSGSDLRSRVQAAMGDGTDGDAGKECSRLGDENGDDCGEVSRGGGGEERCGGDVDAVGGDTAATSSL